MSQQPQNVQFSGSSFDPGSLYPSSVPAAFRKASRQAAPITNANTAHVVRGDLSTNTAADAKAGLDALGVRINDLLAALRAAGIVTP